MSSSCEVPLFLKNFYDPSSRNILGFSSLVIICVASLIVFPIIGQNLVRNYFSAPSGLGVFAAYGLPSVSFTSFVVNKCSQASNYELTCVLPRLAAHLVVKKDDEQLLIKITLNTATLTKIKFAKIYEVHTINLPSSMNYCS